MPVVTVTGNAWDHTGGPLPASIVPELWFRPKGAVVTDGALLTPREVKANLDLATGAFTVDLVAGSGVLYTPVLSWLLNPDASTPQEQARGWAEWNFTINPYPNGGPIEQLANTDLTIFTVLVSLDPPPAGYKGWYLNAGPGDPNDPSQSGTGVLEIVS